MTAATEWPIVVVQDWRHFDDILSRFDVAAPGFTPYMYRGQSRAEWSLQPSLARLLPAGLERELALEIENRGLHEFRSQATLHLSNMPGWNVAPWHWWALMQHYRAPTRLLDWSESPFVAAYFCCERDWDSDGAVWITHTITALGRSDEESVEARFHRIQTALTAPTAAEEMMVYFPHEPTQRMVAQQGCFSVSTNPLANHSALIHALCTAAGGGQDPSYHLKLIIPCVHKPHFLRRLRAMNVSANSLFPGIDGLGYSVAELVRLRIATGPSEPRT